MAVGNCSITNCNNKGTQGGNDNFFRIPKDRQRALQWLRFCKKGTSLKSGRVCSNHFVATDYKSLDKARPYLTENAVPTQCLSGHQKAEKSPPSNENLKEKLRTVLYSTEYCGVCLDNKEDNVNIPATAVNIVDASGDRNIGLSEIVDEVFHGQGPDLLASQYLCSRCIESILNSYVFIQKAKLTSRLLHQQIPQLTNNAELILDNIDELNGTDHVILTTFSADLNPSVSETYYEEGEIKMVDFEIDKTSQDCKNCHSTGHKNCLFSCTECPNQPCLHKEYIKYFAEQSLAGSSDFKCLDCDQSVKTKSLYIEHVDRVHQMLDIICDECGETFHSNGEINEHKLEFHRHSCGNCDGEFYSKITLEDHMKECHISDEICFETHEDNLTNDETLHALECEGCNFKTITKQGIIDYIKTAHPTKPHHCSICQLCFLSHRELIQHRRSHPADSKHRCRYCEKCFKTNQSCKDHELSHTRPEALKAQGMRYLCDTCGRGFPFIGELNSHRKNHTGLVTCSICGKQLKPSSMKSHAWRHRGYSLDPNFQARIRQRRMKHACGTCDYKTSSRLYLESHVNRFHLLVRPYECAVCGKAFSGAHLLQIHMEVHNRSRNYSCATCGRRFGRALGLTLHERGAHSGERPYCCERCGDKFISASLLSRHRHRVHSGARAACPLCRRQLSSLPEVRRHLRRVHWRGGGAPRLSAIPGLSGEHLRMLEDRRRAPVVRGFISASTLV